MAKEESTAPRREYARIVLTLDNVLVPAEKLSPTPSMLDGLDSETEMDLRILGCELIQRAGILLKLPQVAMATGQVIFQRFYYSKSYVKHNMEVVAMACINLASKIEEAPRRVRDVVNVVHRIKQIRAGKTMTPLILDQNYINLKNQVIKSERRILKELGFCVHVKHPHKIIVMYMNVLEQQSNQRFVQCAWNYMNDSFRTNVFVRFHPETIACACIYLAARQLQIALPNDPAWYGIFDVREHDLHDICLSILRLYARKKPDPEKLEAIVNEAKKLHIEAKLKAKGLSSDGGTPISTSRPGTPTKVSPSPLTLSKIKSEDDKSDSSAGVNHNSRKKRGHSASDDSRSRSHSRSRSRSPRDKSRSRSPYSSRSRSTSRSPAAKRKYRDSPKKYKKDNHHISNDKNRSRHKNRYRSPSPNSGSRSNDRSPVHKSYKKVIKKHRSRSRTPERERHKVSKYRSRSRSRERSRKSKKHNGHRRSRSRERYRR